MKAIDWKTRFFEILCHRDHSWEYVDEELEDTALELAAKKVREAVKDYEIQLDQSFEEWEESTSR